jgi:filamentous hemagglutinin family protein
MLLSNLLILLLIWLSTGSTVSAQVTLDGTLGRSGALPGPNYQIGANLGQQYGPNLFHSFRDFSLQSHESATFSGPTNVQNIISRVTGGNPSSIDGLLRSTIPNADMYLLNPAGIMFGPHAKLDVQGSFHASTAHTLKLQNGGEFNARTPANSLLTIAPIASFGFIDDNIAPISVVGAGEINNYDWQSSPLGLHVPEGKAFSLIGGALEIKNGTFFRSTMTNQPNTPSSATTSLPLISAANGRLTLVSVASPSDISLAAEGVTLSPNSRLGQIHIGDQALLNVSGPGAGKVFIRSGQLVIDQSEIQATTQGHQSDGKIEVQTDTLSLTHGARLSGNTTAAGKGADITIQATGNVTVTGVDPQGRASSIKTGAEATEKGRMVGDSGTIDLTARDLTLKEGGLISSSSIAHHGGNSGQAGNINLNIAGQTELSGVNPAGENAEGFGSGIYARTRGMGENTKQGGNISLKTDSLKIENGAMINSGTNNNANAGNLDIQAHTVTISGDSTGTSLPAPASSQLNYLTGQTPPASYNESTSGLYAQSDSQDPASGAGGNIHLAATDVTLSNHGHISTTAAGGGHAGEITLEATQLHLDSQASIAANSRLANTNDSPLANLAERDSQILIQGDVIDIADMGDGRAGRYVHTNTGLINVTPVYSVSNLAELRGLTQKKVISSGEVVEVTDAGKGNPGRFIYAYDNHSHLATWIPFSNGVQVTLPDLTALNKLTGWFKPGTALYPAGTVIQVNHAANGKPALYIYAQLVDPTAPDWLAVTTFRLNHFTVTNTNELNSLTRYALAEGDTATMTDNNTKAQLVYHAGEWLKFNNNVHPVANIQGLNDLKVVPPGYRLKVAEAGNGQPQSFIYSGTTWIPLHQERQVATLAQRDALAPQTGDVVTVTEIGGNGVSQQFLAVDGNWIKLVKGGSAGNLSLTADSLRLTNNSQLTTATSGRGPAGQIEVRSNQVELRNKASISAASQSPQVGGNAGTVSLQVKGSIRLSDHSSISAAARNAKGGQIDLQVGQRLEAMDSQVTSSVQTGNGNSGEITVNADKVILNKSQIITRAYQGTGGTLKITTNELYPNLSTVQTSRDADSFQGMAGVVIIRAPNIDVNSKLAKSKSPEIPNQLKRGGDEKMKTSCNAKDNDSTFTVTSGDGTPTQPNDLVPSGPLLSKTKKVKTTAETSSIPTSQPPPLKVSERKECSNQ